MILNNLNNEEMLLYQLRAISKNIDSKLKISLINDNTVFVFSINNKAISVSYDSLKHYEKEDVIYHAINMIRRKGNESYYNSLKYSPL